MCGACDPRGKGKFKRITWDEALDTLASKLKRVKETYGPSAIMSRDGGGDVKFINEGETYKTIAIPFWRLFYGMGLQLLGGVLFITIYSYVFYPLPGSLA